MNTARTREVFYSKTKKSVFALAAVATGFVSSTLFADDTKAWQLDKPLVPFTASYSVGNNTVIAGQAEIELRQTESGSEWHYALSTRPTGLFRLAGRGRVQESATFEIVNENNRSILKPKSYKFRQDNELKRAIDATFIWDQKQLYFKRGDENAAADLNTNTLDRLTMTVAMMSILNPEFSTINMPIFDGGRLKEVQLVNEGIETIKTALGDVETVRVRTGNVAGSKRETITWFAPSMNNLPVRIEQLKEGGLVARLSVSQYKAKR